LKFNSQIYKMKQLYSLSTFRYKVFFSFFVILFHSFLSFSQSVKTRWTVNPYDEKVFTENKGQFANLEHELNCKILFSFEQGNTAFFLCSDQFIVREEKEAVSSEREEEHDPARSHYPNISFSYLRFYFGNANNSVSVVGERKLSARNTYNLKDINGTNKMITASSFEKVIYKNIYDGIDMIFSAHEKNGMKYQYVLHPFADASLINIRYSGAGNLIVNENGNLHAGFAGNEIIDHAPNTFYADNHATISSAYDLQKNGYSFKTGNYDRHKTIIIDPWVVNPNFTNQNRAFDIARDTAGNVYVFGGQTPWKLKKFNPNGNLIWTFNTSFNSWYGALAVDQVGNAFITEGCCGGNIQKIDSSGNVGWTRTYGTYEFWRLVFNCDFSRLYLGTGYSAGGNIIQESISILDTSNGNVNNSTSIFAAQSEPRALAIGPNGDIYTISCQTGTTPNEVAAMTPLFTTLFTNSDGYSLLYNGPLYANGANTTSGQNAIACGKVFFCTTNGNLLFKRNLNTGAKIDSVIIPGGSTELNSGILVDNCNHIYVGSSNGVVEFDSSLNVMSTTPTSGAVYCLTDGKNGELLACGDGFIASLGVSSCGVLCDSTTSINIVAHFTSSDTAFCTETGECIHFFDHSTGNPISWQWKFTGAFPDTSTLQNPDSICYTTPGTYPVTLIVSNGTLYDTLAVSPLIIYANSPPPPIVTLIGGDTLISSHASYYQWYFNGSIIAGAADSFYVATNGGTYAVQITDSLGCTSISNGVTYTGINSSLSDGFQVNIYPNPVGEWLRVSSLEFGVNARIEIYNVVGQRVYDGQLQTSNTNPQTINCKSFASGIYFIKIANEKINIVRKFVKE